MVGGAAVLAHASAGDAVEHDIGGDVDVDHEVERSPVEHALERLGLHQRAGEAVEHVAAVEWPAHREAVFDHPDHDLVGHQLAAVEEALDLVPDRRPGGDRARKRSPVERWTTP